MRPIGVRCETCGWRGARKHPHRRPCPKCGGRINVTMSHGVYLICVRDPVTGLHANLTSEDGTFARNGHYIGYYSNPLRIAHHREGDGATFTAVAVSLGLELVVARTWPGMDRTFERKLKNRKEAPKLCPLCNPAAMRRANATLWSESLSA